MRSPWSASGDGLTGCVFIGSPHGRHSALPSTGVARRPGGGVERCSRPARLPGGPGLAHRPVLGTVVFCWGGWPFLAGAVPEMRSRQPGMMLLISHGDHRRVRRVAGHQRSAGFDLDFWWELAALVDDHAARPLAGDEGDRPGPGRARRARRAAARRGRAGRPRRRRRDGAGRRRCGRATSCWSAPAAGCRPTATIVDGEAELDESMITGESRPVAKRAGRPGRRRHGRDRLGDPGPGRRRRRRHRAGRHPAPRRRGPGVAVAGPGAGRPRRRAAVLRRHRRRRGHLRRVDAARRARRGRRAHRDRAGHRLPARARPGDPAGDRDLDRGGRPGRHPGQGPAGAGTDAHASTPCCSTRPAR